MIAIYQCDKCTHQYQDKRKVEQECGPLAVEFPFYHIELGSKGCASPQYDKGYGTVNMIVHKLRTVYFFQYCSYGEDKKQDAQ